MLHDVFRWHLGQGNCVSESYISSSPTPCSQKSVSGDLLTVLSSLSEKAARNYMIPLQGKHAPQVAVRCSYVTLEYTGARRPTYSLACALRPPLFYPFPRAGGDPGEEKGQADPDAAPVDAERGRVERVSPSAKQAGAQNGRGKTRKATKQGAQLMFFFQVAAIQLHVGAPLLLRETCAAQSSCKGQKQGDDDNYRIYW